MYKITAKYTTEDLSDFYQKTGVFLPETLELYYSRNEETGVYDIALVNNNIVVNNSVLTLNNGHVTQDSFSEDSDEKI